MLAWVRGWLGVAGQVSYPTRFQARFPGYGGSTVELRPEEPHHTVRSHRAGPCSSPPIPREAGPHGLHPRYVAAHASLYPSRPSLPSCKATVVEGLCMGKGLGREAVGLQEML